MNRADIGSAASEEVFAGVDVHRKSYSVCALRRGVVALKSTVPAKPGKLVDLLCKRFPGQRVRTVYEAGFSGFVSHRVLDPCWPEHPWVIHSRSFGMMVRQGYWGAGVAQLLMQSLFGFAEGNGIRRIEGRVRVTNLRGIQFYERAGFVVEGKHRVGAVIDGQDIDDLTIARVR